MQVEDVGPGSCNVMSKSAHLDAAMFESDASEVLEANVDESPAKDLPTAPQTLSRASGTGEAPRLSEKLLREQPQSYCKPQWSWGGHCWDDLVREAAARATTELLEGTALFRTVESLIERHFIREFGASPDTGSPSKSSSCNKACTRIHDFIDIVRQESQDSIALSVQALQSELTACREELQSMQHVFVTLAAKELTGEACVEELQSMQHAFITLPAKELTGESEVTKRVVSGFALGSSTECCTREESQTDKSSRVAQEHSTKATAVEGFALSGSTECGTREGSQTDKSSRFAQEHSSKAAVVEAGGSEASGSELSQQPGFAGAENYPSSDQEAEGRVRSKALGCIYFAKRLSVASGADCVWLQPEPLTHAAFAECSGTPCNSKPVVTLPPTRSRRTGTVCRSLLPRLSPEPPATPPLSSRSAASRSRPGQNRAARDLQGTKPAAPKDLGGPNMGQQLKPLSSEARRAPDLRECREEQDSLMRESKWNWHLSDLRLHVSGVRLSDDETFTPPNAKRI